MFDTLSTHNISFCGISHPLLPNEVVVNTETLYYRFHGVPHLYYSAYNESFLQHIVNAIQKAKQVKQAFVYFNNTAQTAAIQNAQYVQQLLAK